MSNWFEQTLYKRKCKWSLYAWKVSHTSHQGNGNENHGEILFHTYLKGNKIQKTMSTAGMDVEQLELVYITAENENGRTTLENDLEVS